MSSSHVKPSVSAFVSSVLWRRLWSNPIRCMDIKGQGAVGASGTRAARVSVARGRGVRAARGPQDHVQRWDPGACACGQSEVMMCS